MAYDEMLLIFDEIVTTQECYHDMYRTYIQRFDFTGTILVLACGTGIFARCLHEVCVPANISGVDVSPASIAIAQQFYDNPIALGDLWTEIMNAGKYDHIAAFGAMHFFDAPDVIAIIVRMWMCAWKSVSFEVDGMSQEHLDRIHVAEGPGWRNFNNVAALQNSGVPRGWRKVLERRALLYRSPETGLEVS